MADIHKPISKIGENLTVNDTDQIQVSAAAEKIYTASQTQLVLSVYLNTNSPFWGSVS